MPKLIHSGDRTHSQLQSFTGFPGTSFNTMNATVSNPANPIPDELELDTFRDIYCLLF